MAWKVYAVRKGYKTGLFYSWPDCNAAINGFKGAQFKGFNTDDEAMEYLKGGKTKAVSSKEDAAVYDYEVYTDGSYKNSVYSWAFAFVKNGEIEHERSGKGNNQSIVSMRNVAGELEAVIEAVKLAKSLGVKIKIYHDYTGIAYWVNGTWRAINPFVQEYKKFMECHSGTFSFQKVKSHSGTKFNDHVDRKAKAALKAS